MWIGGGATTVAGFKGTQGLKIAWRSWFNWLSLNGLSEGLFGPLHLFPCLLLQAFDM
jgi:hypothetical protein